MPEVVPAKINDSGLADAFLEPAFPIATLALTGTGADVGKAIPGLSQRLERLSVKR